MNSRIPNKLAIRRDAQPSKLPSGEFRVPVALKEMPVHA
jgi:hypothetical protein